MQRVAVVVTAALVGTPAQAQDKTSEIDRIFSFATPATPGCVVGVSQHGRVLVSRAYGLADVDRRAPLSPTSIFDIGSTQKQFVAAAALLLAEEGRLSLSDDVRKHVPELPDYGHRITVDHLLTHTSGIRDWTGILPLAEEGQDAFKLILRQRGLNFVPGEEWAYSNSGFVLLREIIARASGMPFPEFLRRRVFAPLGMTSSSYVADVLKGSGNVALAYEEDGAGWRKHMRLGNNRGGGALLSNASDLLTWNEALTNGRLGAFVTEKLQETARLNNGRRLSYARGLFVQTQAGHKVVWHSGGAAGYSTWLGRLPEHGLSLAVLCNREPISATALTGRVVDLFVPPLGAETAESQGAGSAAGAAVDVSGRAGLFLDERTGEPLRLVVNSSRLQIAGGPPLVAVAAGRFRPVRRALFFRSEDEFEMHFVSPDRFELKSMEGEVTRFRRAQPWTPTAADLQAFDGRYHSNELGSVFEIVPGKDGLVMRFERSPEKSLELSAVDRDMFMRSMMVVRFSRDGSGKVVGFEYNNPVARHIRFSRLGDRATKMARDTSATPAPVTKDSAAASTGPTSAAPRLEALTGEYELAPGRTLAITLEEGRLHGQPPGSEKRALTHVSGTTFSVAGSQITLTFTLGAEGPATAVVMRQGGRDRTLPKVR